MTDEPADNPAKEMFLAVVDLPPADRKSWLDANCPPENRAAVEALLARHDEATGSVETLAWGIVERDVEGAAPEETAFDAFDMLDEFRILRKIESGGMATVYLAEDTSLQRRVALKVLPAHAALSEVKVARFRQEAVTVAQLHHPGIVPIHRVGFARGVHYLAIEFVDGPTLAARIKDAREDAQAAGTALTRSGGWVREQALLIAKVADALECAHQHEVIHRDVKPSNIMIDTDGEPRLTDFGIARNLRLESMTVTGQLAGTIPYMSPEQARASGSRVDHRTDIFSLGITLYEAISLRRPFTGDTMEEVRQKVIWKMPPKVGTLNPAIARDLETITHKALEKDPTHRYQTAAHMAADLRCCLDGRPILARRPGLVRRLRTWGRDHKLGSMAAMIAVLVLAVALLVVANGAIRRATMTPVTLTIDRTGARVRSQQFDRVTGDLHAAVDLGTAPVTGHRLDPGLYLFTFADDAGDLAEAIAYLPRPDERIDLRTGHDASAEPIAVRVRAPRSDADDDMVRIPGGDLTVPVTPGVGSDEETRVVRIRDLWIDRCEVTNGEYMEFVKATGHALPFGWSGSLPGLIYDPALGDRPVVGITRADAAAYAHWRGKRLPTADEWEYAMRWPDGRRYPWGSATPKGLPEPGKADTDRGGSGNWSDGLAMYLKYVRPADSDPQFDTAAGIRHGNTNVSEITASFDFARSVTVSCGANWSHGIARPDLAYRGDQLWNTSSLRLGFRCVRTVTPR